MDFVCEVEVGEDVGEEDFGFGEFVDGGGDEELQEARRLELILCIL
jgi:hypothetical protein